MTIPQELEQIVNEVCDKYCKFPEQTLSQYKDPDEAGEHLINDFCENCPLNKLT